MTPRRKRRRVAGSSSSSPDKQPTIYIESLDNQDSMQSLDDVMELSTDYIQSNDSAKNLQSSPSETLTHDYSNHISTDSVHIGADGDGFQADVEVEAEDPATQVEFQGQVGPDGLTWDRYHVFNKENIYCYCREGRDIAKPMLQCRGCRQWFHPECTSTNTRPRLYHGEHKIIDFVCKNCSPNKRETRNETPRGWKDIAMLAILNVMVDSNSRALKVKSVTDYLTEDWGVTAGRPRTATWWNTLSSAITTNQKLFQNIGDYYYTVVDVDEKYPEIVGLLPPPGTMKRKIAEGPARGRRKAESKEPGSQPKKKRGPKKSKLSFSLEDSLGEYDFNGLGVTQDLCDVTKKPRGRKRRTEDRIDWVGAPFSKTDQGVELYSACMKNGCTYRLHEFVYLHPNDDGYIKFLESKEPATSEDGQLSHEPPRLWVVQIVDLLYSKERGMHFYGHWFYTWNDIDYLTQSKSKEECGFSNAVIDSTAAQSITDIKPADVDSSLQEFMEISDLNCEFDSASKQSNTPSFNTIADISLQQQQHAYDPKLRRRDPNELFPSFETVYKPISSIAGKCRVRFEDEGQIYNQTTTKAVEDLRAWVAKPKHHYTSVAYNGNQNMFYSLPKDITMLWQLQQQQHPELLAEPEEEIKPLPDGRRKPRSDKGLSRSSIGGLFSPGKQTVGVKKKAGRIPGFGATSRLYKGKIRRRTADFDINKMVSYDSGTTPRWSMLESLNAQPAKTIETPGFRENLPGATLEQEEIAAVNVEATTPVIPLDESSEEEDISDAIYEKLHLVELGKERVRRSVQKKQQKDKENKKDKAADSAHNIDIDISTNMEINLNEKPHASTSNDNSQQDVGDLSSSSASASSDETEEDEVEVEEVEEVEEEEEEEEKEENNSSE